MDFQVKTRQCINHHSILYNSHHHIISSPKFTIVLSSIYIHIVQQVIINKESSSYSSVNNYHHKETRCFTRSPNRIKTDISPHHDDKHLIHQSNIDPFLLNMLSCLQIHLQVITIYRIILPKFVSFWKVPIFQVIHQNKVFMLKIINKSFAYIT